MCMIQHYCKPSLITQNMNRNKNTFVALQNIALVTFLLAITLAVSSCSGAITIDGITFGPQRKPNTVVIVGNDHPNYHAAGSVNWSGYIVRARDVTRISAEWQTPQVSEPVNSDSSTWVGIGGVAPSPSLIQAGTDQQVVNGKPYYYAWIETLPSAPKPISQINLLPGDEMSVSIVNIGVNTWQITVNDKTSGQLFTETLNYASCLCSAEWIEEAPSVNVNHPIMANYHSVTFTNAAYMREGKSLALGDAAEQAVKLVSQDGQTISQPQILDSSSMFSVVYIG